MELQGGAGNEQYYDEESGEMKFVEKKKYVKVEDERKIGELEERILV